MTDKVEKEVYKCSGCKCKYFIEDFGFTRLEKRYKICVKCREKKKIKKCDQCDYSTTNSGALTTHKRTHTGEKPYACDQCDKSFSQNSSLISHKRTHTGEKPYECDQCDYKCSESGHLTRHKRTHTGDKPYECDQCDYKCSDSSAFTRHKRIHTGEKPYACDKCDYKCTTSGYLTIHKRIHTGEKPYECYQCDYKCSDSSDLTRHKNFHCNRGNPAKNTSAAELHTILVLKELGLLFIHDMSYDNVRHIKPLRFDHRVNPDTPYQFFIEVDGAQHTKPNRLMRGEEGFKIIQLRDKIKDDYCGDRLLRIPHTVPLKDYRKLILDFATRHIIVYDE
jgi:uncharacterized Zn-finger protein